MTTWNPYNVPDLAVLEDGDTRETNLYMTLEGTGGYTTEQAAGMLDGVIKNFPKLTTYPTVQAREILLETIKLAQRMLDSIQVWLSKPTNLFVQDQMWALAKPLMASQSNLTRKYFPEVSRAGATFEAPALKDDIVRCLSDIKVLGQTTRDLDAMKPWWLDNYSAEQYIMALVKLGEIEEKILNWAKGLVPDVGGALSSAKDALIKWTLIGGGLFIGYKLLTAKKGRK